MPKLPIILTLLLLLVLALAFRVPSIADRPLHGDEMVNIEKFNILRNTGTYTYDPHEYHGPVLPYATLPIVAMQPNRSYVESDEATYRMVSVVLGTMLVVLTMSSASAIGWPAAIAAALLVAVSAMMVFYSRYYIHEMPFVVSSWAMILCSFAFVRQAQKATPCRYPWLLPAGIGIAFTFMHASKETAIITWFSITVACVGMLLVRGATADRDGPLQLRRIFATRPLLIASIAAIALNVLLFSAFFTNLRGPLDSILTFANYIGRGSSGGESLHTQPWYFYFQRLGYFRYTPRGPWFSEAAALLLGSIGILAAGIGKGIHPKHIAFVRFLSIYTIVQLLVYVAIPYKTPWSILVVYHSILVLAGVGSVALIKWAPHWIGKSVVSAVLIAAVFHMGMQSVQLNHAKDTRLSAGVLNPWVYAHTVPQIRDIGDRVELLAKLHEEATGEELRVRVLYVEGMDNLWPLPFYLRRVPQVGYLQQMPSDDDAAVLLLSISQINAIDEQRLEPYEGPRLYGIRKGVHLGMYIRHDLNERFMDHVRNLPSE